jgi:hypothetical protein
MQRTLMTVRYTNSFTEVLMFHINTYMRWPLIWAVLAMLAALDIYDTWDILSEESSEAVDPWEFAITAFASIILTLGMMLGLLALGIYGGKDAWSKVAHTVTLTDTDIIEETPYKRTDYRWHGIVRLARTKKHLSIWSSQSEGTVIPRRAFENEDTWNAFHEFCMKKTGRA